MLTPDPNASGNSKPDLPRATPGDLHILVAPGVGSLLLCLARGPVLGVLNQGNVSVNSKPDHLSWVTPRDSHTLVAPGVGFSLFCFAQGSARGLLNQSNFEKARFLLCLLNNICLYMLEVSSVT